jgi:hypothetical protein
MAERLNAPVLKTVRIERLSGVESLFLRHSLPPRAPDSYPSSVLLSHTARDVFSGDCVASGSLRTGRFLAVDEARNLPAGGRLAEGLGSRDLIPAVMP